MAKGHKTGGRGPGAVNKATAEVRHLAGAFGPAVIAELTRLAGIAVDEDGKPMPEGAAESAQARISALGMLLGRAYGRSPLSMPVKLALPDTSTPEGVVEAMARIVKAVAKGELSPAQAKDLTEVIEAQRRAIELGDHETRLRAIEARAGITPGILGTH